MGAYRTHVIEAFLEQGLEPVYERKGPHNADCLIFEIPRKGFLFFICGEEVAAALRSFCKTIDEAKAEVDDFCKTEEALANQDAVAAVFIPGQQPGAIKNGTRVRKTNAAPKDAHHNGDTGVVMSSPYPAIQDPDGPDGKMVFGYFVAWDDMPGVPIFVSGRRIEEV